MVNRTCFQNDPQSLPIPAHATMALQIDLAAIRHNYHLTRKAIVSNCSIAGVVKSDGYGVGMSPLASTLWDEGCRVFFVAFIEEGIHLRQILPKADIYVLSGLLPHCEEIFQQYNLIPVIVDLGQFQRWQRFAIQLNKSLPAILHVDTGMVRNGLVLKDIETLLKHNNPFDGLVIHYIMSHLASSEDRKNPENEKQRLLFDHLRHLLPPAKASFSNSSGLMLGKAYHYDLVRPGIGLLGYAHPYPFDEEVLPCLRALGRVVQIHNCPMGQGVGYNASFHCKRPSRLATLGLGYRDGIKWQRTENRAVRFAQHQAPIVGRVSMDFTLVDITDIPESEIEVGTWATIFDTFESVHQFSHLSQSFHYELLTSLGTRYHKQYLNGKDK